MEDFFVGIVSKNRYQPLQTLLYSLQGIGRSFVMLVDSSTPRYDLSHVKTYDALFYNQHPDMTTVMHNKNMIMRFFLQNTACKYLFIIEDDVKILDTDIFYEYINVSQKYNIPHMNFSIPDNEQVVYDFKNDVKVVDKLHGCFSFYTRDCLFYSGLMNERLNGNCWEHIEHTYRIHRTFKYDPEFWHFPDYKWSHDGIRMQKVPGTISTPPDKREYYRQVMCQELKIRGLPLLSTKRLTINT